METVSPRRKAINEINNHFKEVEALLQDLNLGRSARISKLIQEGQAKLEKENHDRELARIERERQIQEEKLRYEQAQQKRLAELKIANAKAEEERRRAEEAVKRNEEQKKQEELRAKQEAEAKSQREARELAAKQTAEAEAKAKAKEAEEKAKKEKEAAAVSAAATAATATATAAAAKPQQPVQPNTTPTQSPNGQRNRAVIEAEYAEYMKRIQWIKTNVKEALSNESKEIKNQTMDIKLQLRPKFGQLTNSKSQLIACRNAVKQLFTSAQQNQLIYHWLLNLYSKMLIEQSESEANVKHQNALPLAMLTVLLWSEFPELGDFVIPRFVKRCPQLIGYYCSINTSEGRKKMGWRKDDDTGKYETQEQYMGRLSGICAVWSCMTQTKVSSQALKGEHPYPLSHSWKFLARTLNKPSADITNTDYTLVAAWWDMTAMRFLEAFGKQALKLLDLAWNQWTEGKMDPPAMRLRGLGENWKSSGKIEAAWKPLQP